MYRLWAGRFLSGTGAAIADIALAAEVYQRTGSPVWLSITLLLTFGISGLFGPLAGVIADKFDRRKVMITSECASAVVWSALLLSTEIWWLLLFGFLGSLIAQPFYAAAQASIPNIVDPEDLGWANGLMSTAWGSASIIGFALGGVITTVWSAQAAFAINAVSFVVSALIVMTIHVSFQGEREATHERLKAMDGFRVLWHHPALRALFIVWTVQYLTIDIVLVAELPLAGVFGLGAIGYGWMMSAWAIGGLIGSLVSMKFMTRKREVFGVVAGTTGIGIGLGIIAVAPTFAIVLAGEAVSAFSTNVDDVGGNAIYQRHTQDENRGRVFAVIHTAGMLANAFGFMFAGFLVEAFGPRPIYAGAAVVSLALVLLLRPLAHLDRSGPAPLEP